MRIRCLNHAEYHGRAYLPEWAAGAGHDWAATFVPGAPALPVLESFDALVIMGGPMSIWEQARHPWLAGEKRFLESVLAADKPVVGVCLGAQMLAEIFGASVYPGQHKEIGWFPLEISPEARRTWVGDALPGSLMTFFWHGDSFDLPHSATRLAHNSAFPNQGFVCGRAIALQFHLEVTPEWVRHLATRDAAELVTAPYIQAAESILGQPPRVYRDNNALMDRLLSHWLWPDRASG